MTFFYFYAQTVWVDVVCMQDDCYGDQVLREEAELTEYAKLRRTALPHMPCRNCIKDARLD
jgi:hypothetical protein